MPGIGCGFARASERLLRSTLVSTFRFLFSQLVVAYCFHGNRGTQEFTGHDAGSQYRPWCSGFSKWWSVRPMNVFTLLSVCVRVSLNLSVYVRVFVVQEHVPFVRSRCVRLQVNVSSACTCACCECRRAPVCVYIRMLVLFLGCWLCRKGALLCYQVSANGLIRPPSGDTSSLHCNLPSLCSHWPAEEPIQPDSSLHGPTSLSHTFPFLCQQL